MKIVKMCLILLHNTFYLLTKCFLSVSLFFLVYLQHVLSYFNHLKQTQKISVQTFNYGLQFAFSSFSQNSLKPAKPRSIWQRGRQRLNARTPNVKFVLVRAVESTPRRQLRPGGTPSPRMGVDRLGRRRRWKFGGRDEI